MLFGAEAPGDGLAGDLAGPAGGVGVAAAAGGPTGGVAQRDRAGEGEAQGGDLVGAFCGPVVLGGGRVGHWRGLLGVSCRRIHIRKLGVSILSGITLGVTPRQQNMFGSTVAYCEGRVPADSIYGVLHRQCFALFPDEMFADLFTDVGRRCVPPMIVAVVMVRQRIEGCSDREAVDRFAFDTRWKYAAGGLDFDYPGFVHTVLVDMRARLAASERPDRIFEVTLEAARKAGLIGRRRVLDSTPLYDAVATMDTVTLIRSGIRGLLKVAGAELGADVGSVTRRDDDYTAAGKPVCDYDDAVARKVLVDALAKDAMALLGALHGRELDGPLSQAGKLLATLVGATWTKAPTGCFG